MKRSITKETILELSKQTNKGNATLTNNVFITLTSYYLLPSRHHWQRYEEILTKQEVIAAEANEKLI
jgi:hypothetical protein